MFWKRKENQKIKTIDLLLNHIRELHSQNSAIVDMMVTAPERQAKIDQERADSIREWISPFIQNGELTKLIEAVSSAFSKGERKVYDEMIQQLEEEHEEVKAENKRIREENNMLKVIIEGLRRPQDEPEEKSSPPKK